MRESPSQIIRTNKIITAIFEFTVINIIDQNYARTKLQLKRTDKFRHFYISMGFIYFITTVPYKNLYNSLSTATELQSI